MPYDADVIVLGAGPAGLAAATRVRWVKGYHALAGSVIVVDPGPPGGLLSWGSCVLTGPGWAYSGEALTATLMADIARLRIPIRRERVTGVHRDGPRFAVTLASGDRLTCLAVIVATGFRPLGNEAELYLRGVRITFKGYEHFPSLVRACVKDATGRGLAVIGNAKTAHLAELLRPEVTAEAGPLTLVTDEALVQVEGTDAVEAIVLRAQDGTLRRIACGAVLLDYNGFELTPDFALAGLPLVRDARGFLAVDAWMRTSEPGVFAAGDVTGRWASTLMALGDGVSAGFGAYQHAFRAKLGRDPVLFAYAATDAALPAQPKDLPELPEDAVPVAVGPAPAWIDGHATIAALALREAVTTDVIRERLTVPIAEKTVTIHRLSEGP